MKSKNTRRKFQKFIVGFAIVFFLVLGLLTWFSDKVDSMVYPTVTVATTYSGSLDTRQDTYYYSNTIVPTASIHGGKLWYALKDSKGDYYVHTTDVTIIRQTSVKSEVSLTVPFVLPICSSNKELHDGDRVLVKAGVL